MSFFVDGKRVKRLTGERSVHLADWPTAEELPADPALVTAMDEVRGVCSTVLSLRKAQHLRVRLPLPLVTVATPGSAHLEPFVDLIKDEVNVKKVVTTDDVEAHGRFEIAVNARVAGPRLGKDVQKVIKAVKAGDWTESEDGVVTAAGIELLPEEYTSRLVAAEPESTAALPDGNGLVVLDTAVSEELEAEGWAKDRIRELQDARRNLGLDVSDRISVQFEVPADRAEWAARHRDLIAGEVLATTFDLGPAGPDSIELGEGVRASITKA